MLRIELNDEQAEVLRELLHQQVSDLGMEIAATERLEFRDQLKQRRKRYNEMLEALQRARSQPAA